METLELVNILYPEHDRTSCSDDDISNGFSFEYDTWNDKTENISGRYLPRCSRCALLEISNGSIPLNENNKRIVSKYFN